jgi:hypothetical protein
MRRRIVSTSSCSPIFFLMASYIIDFISPQHLVRLLRHTFFFIVYAVADTSVNKTLGAMTGLEFDNIDILGPVKGRLGMGYFDCFCVPSVSSAPPTPENPNPASSRHCT